MKAKVLTKRDLVEWVDEQPFSITLTILFGGERLYHCDEAVGVVVKGKIVAVASIAPHGEGTGTPTIVGLYTIPEHRRAGYGAVAFQAAIKRCRQRAFEKVRVDVTSGYVTRMIAKLPAADLAYLRIHDSGSVMDLFN